MEIPFVRSKDAVAVDLGSSSIKIIYLKKSGNSYTLVKWGLINLKEANKIIPFQERRKAVINHLIDLLTKENIPIKNAVTSVSGNQVIVRNVQFNKMSVSELEKTIPFEAEPFIPFDINDVDLSFYILPNGNPQQKMDVMVVAAKKEVSKNKLDILDSAGLRPVVIDIDTFALCNAYELNSDPSSKETVLIANIGTNITNISIIAGHTVRVVRDVYFGAANFINDLIKLISMDTKSAEEAVISGSINTENGGTQNLEAEKLSVSDILTETAKGLFTELSKSIDFYISQQPDSSVNRVLICGGGALINNLDKYLSKQLKTPVDIFNPLRALKGSEKIPKNIAHQFAVAVGLGLRYENDTYEN